MPFDSEKYYVSGHEQALTLIVDAMDAGCTTVDAVKGYLKSINVDDRAVVSPPQSAEQWTQQGFTNAARVAYTLLNELPFEQAYAAIVEAAEEEDEDE